jgi:tRNA modification GTPase
MTATIYAPATGPGRAGVAVVRVSGPAAADAVIALTGRPVPPPRRAVLRRLADPRNGDLLDQGLCIWFPAPGSFTGEDVAELHLHGSRAVVSAVAEVLGALPGLRLAEPGEFSRRAFENGKLDLTEVEAIADLVAAETAAQRRQALRQMDGALGRLYDGWRDRLTRALAHLEADIDFPDEDLPGGMAAATRSILETLKSEILVHLDDDRRGERLRDGIEVAILGAPNAGKSSLLNALAQRDAAIVSAQAGTTRDIVEVHLDLGGYPVILADTAGLREAGDLVEQEGIRRALRRAEAADIRLAVFDAGVAWDRATLDLVDGSTIVVVNKVDEAVGACGPKGGWATVRVSARTGAGIADLLGALTTLVRARFDATGGATLTRARHRQALEECRDALARALGAPLPELAAEDVRLASRALGRITGRVDVEDLLDVIFRDFCIGK